MARRKKRLRPCVECKGLFDIDTCHVAIEIPDNDVLAGRQFTIRCQSCYLMYIDLCWREW